jgi:glycerophosphoryl diester phosphodiesterase
VSGRVVEVVGHGGAGDFFPGNSRPAIEQALKIGVDRVEFDVQRSGDGDLVLVHDERIKRGPGKGVAVRAAPTSQLRELLPGLLTLDEAVELIGDRAGVVVDVKAPGYERAIVNAVRRHGLVAQDAIVSSTYAHSLIAIGRGAPGVRLGLSTGHLSTSLRHSAARMLAGEVVQALLPYPLLGVATSLGVTDVMIKFRMLSPKLVSLMHEHGIRVNTWTVNRPADIRRVIALGVDSVTSNRPDYARVVADELGVASLRLRSSEAGRAFR